MDTEFTFFTTYIGKINDTLSDYIGSTTISMMDTITPVANNCLLIFVAWWGWAMFQGLISEPWQDGFKRIMKLVIVFGLATKIGLYNDFLADWLWKSPEALASALAKGQNTPTAQFLDEFLSQFFEMFAKFKNAAVKNSTLGVPDLTMLIVGGVILATGILLTGWAAVLLIASKMTLAILLAMG